MRGTIIIFGIQRLKLHFTKLASIYLHEINELIMTIDEFITKLNATPNNIDFKETIATIDAHYDFIPTEFQNGELKNEAGQNSGSCKLFSFAHQLGLDQQQTLNCFGDYYRVDVLQHPASTDHQNIRNFMKYGWQGINFQGSALIRK